MMRLLRPALAALTAVLFLGALAPAAHAQLPTQNTVTGTGEVLVSDPHIFYPQITVDAHSGVGGANPTGTVTFEVFATFHLFIGGPVTCLAVHGNRAVIGFTDTTSQFGPITVVIVDNGTTGTPADTFFVTTIGTDCVTDVPPPSAFVGAPLSSGDFVVREALATKTQCRNGGWRNYTNDQGQPFFKNQGECFGFVKQSVG